MVRVWSAIREGATAYMRRQMMTIILFSPTISIIVTLSVYAGYSGHISTQFTLRNMITPTLSIILTSLIVGLLFGGPAVGALVIGATASGIVLAITMMWAAPPGITPRSTLRLVIWVVRVHRPMQQP